MSLIRKPPWNKGKEHMRGSKHPMFGKRHSEESLNRMSESHKGYHASEDTRQKLSRSALGRTPWNKGKEGVMPEPWNKGKHISEDIRKKISEGHKGQIPWNKGKIGVYTEETLKKMSVVHKGFKHNEESKRKMAMASKGVNNTMYGKMPWNKGKVFLSGEKNPMYGKTHKSITLKKISESLKGKCMGENNPNWQGGRSFEPYCHKFNDRLKEKIRKRDNHTCQLCNEKENGKTLSIHHINHDRENCEPHLISLCRKCHGKANRNKDYYKPIFMNILQTRGLLNNITQR